MSGFDFPIRRVIEGRKSGLKNTRQVDLASKLTEMGKGEAKWQLFKRE
jgi:hypothetical protein